MPGFNFANGNAKKLLSLPLYALGALASLVVPRTDRQWVFGCGSGVGEGSLELFRFARAANPLLGLTWLALDTEELADAAALGIPAVLKSSRRGLWLTLRARVIVVTHGFGDANRYGTRGAFVVQLWHGIPLKLIQLDSPVTTSSGIFSRISRLRGILRRAYQRGYRGISLMPAASELVASRLQTAFGLESGRIAVTGDPRDDVLSRGTADDRSAIARAQLFAGLGLDRDSRARTLLYSPTWRDGAADPGAPTAEEWTRIGEYLEASGSLLVVRPHPHGVGDYAAGFGVSDRIVLLSSSAQPDVTPILPAVDLLITDYSSIAFDFSLTGGPILFLAPDEDSYTASRGLYEPYREFSGGTEVRSWTAILAQLARYDSDQQWAAQLEAHSRLVSERHFAYRDGRNTERVYGEILDRLKAQE
ncbi:CDP-glycerol glycerophosphotransferase family protein [Glaciihabitans sp. UYNi722]|uniref:CDP-glycerol glycerophosphotransferase family protein n=1 Tax=Glaciihabitans sp. UYNi722 TaxID=3156344 RepID=UPI0033969ACD